MGFNFGNKKSYGGGSNWGGSRRANQDRNTTWKAEAENRFYQGQVLKFKNRVITPLTDETIFKSQGPTGINFEEYCKINVERSGRNADEVTTMENFRDIKDKLPKFLRRNIKRMKYAKPTPIQAHAIPVALANRDLMCCAQTGSGKTCAFLLPVVSHIKKRGRERSMRFVSTSSSPEVVIFAPTRELASQIHKEAQKLTWGSQITCVVVYGGVSIRAQLTQLAMGADIVVATPGRLQDFYDREVICFEKVRFLIFDEADRMLDMGFEPQIRSLVQHSDMPARGKRRTAMFSATFPNKIKMLASSFMEDYVWIAVGRVGSTNKCIEQRILKAPGDIWKKLTLLYKVVDPEQRTLIFVRTKRNAGLVAKEMHKRWTASSEIHGGRTQEQREYALKKFREGHIKVLVATNVAARGLDIPGVEHVVIFDLATTMSEFDSYIHRIGRTGRAGHKGIATVFYVPGREKFIGCAKIAAELLKVLVESKQVVPKWFRDLSHVPDRARRMHLLIAEKRKASKRSFSLVNDTDEKPRKKKKKSKKSSEPTKLDSGKKDKLSVAKIKKQLQEREKKNGHSVSNGKTAVSSKKANDSESESESEESDTSDSDDSDSSDSDEVAVKDVKAAVGDSDSSESGGEDTEDSSSASDSSGEEDSSKDSSSEDSSSEDSSSDE